MMVVVVMMAVVKMRGRMMMTSVVAINYCCLLSLAAGLLVAISIHNILHAIYVKKYHPVSLNYFVFKKRWQCPSRLW